MSYEEMLLAVRRMKAAGANIIWISHANPARSFKEEREVGLNPAVYQAFRDFSQLTHDDAVEIVKAQHRMLQACQEVGVKAVLSIGYHTQMGPVWNRQHPQDLRLRADGKLWQVTNGNDPYGSVYSPLFQKDLRDYYNWIEYEFVNIYKNVVMMLNLADEPLGGDYSEWADKEFQKRNGYSFQQVGNFANRQIALGQFQAGVIVDFMRLAANMWQELKPDLPVTMSFDGGAMRVDNGLPNLEALFREAPSNFVLTWDMYPRDRGSFKVSLNENDITRLFFLARAIGGYSAQYGRKVWFWSSANSWGLGQDVSEAGTIADAQANLLYLAQLMVQTGGSLEGIAVWNYNIKTQGLYNYSWGEVKQKATWGEDEMFSRVSAQFEAVRSIISEVPGKPQLLFLRAPEWQYHRIGLSHGDAYIPMLDWAWADVLARNNVVSIEAGHWPLFIPPNWESVKTVVVLSPAEYLTEVDLTGLRNWTAGGGSLVASIEVASLIKGRSASSWNEAPASEVFQQGRLFISRAPTYQLFNSQQTEKYRSFWDELLGLKTIESGFYVRTRSSFLHYYLGQKPLRFEVPLDWSGISHYNSDGTAHQLPLLNQPKSEILRRSEFIFATLSHS